MAQTPERRVKDAVKKILDKFGIWHFSPVMNGLGRTGIPDIICCFEGHFIAIECKAGDNKATPLQLRELSAITDHGGFSFIARENNLHILEDKLRCLRPKI